MKNDNNKPVEGKKKFNGSNDCPPLRMIVIGDYVTHNLLWLNGIAYRVHKETDPPHHLLTR